MTLRLHAGELAGAGWGRLGLMVLPEHLAHQLLHHINGGCARQATNPVRRRRMIARSLDRPGRGGPERGLKWPRAPVWDRPHGACRFHNAIS